MALSVVIGSQDWNANAIVESRLSLPPVFFFLNERFGSHWKAKANVGLVAVCGGLVYSKNYEIN